MKSTQSEEQDALFEVFNELSQYQEEHKPQSLDAAVDDFIIDKVKDALIQENWNQTRASKCLGIKRTTLIAMCKRLNILKR